MRSRNTNYEASLNFIALRVGYSSITIRRRTKGNLLDIGRTLFGIEDKFWLEVM
jgi:hypothetical protein